MSTAYSTGTAQAVAQPVTRPRIVGTAFGDPLAPMTFSGVSRNLFMSLDEMDALAGVVSARQLRWHDVFRGALIPSRRLRWWRTRVSQRWLWSPRGIELLSRRFEECLQRFPDATDLVQIGTHILPACDQLRHYCMTDMTIAQAVVAGQFLGGMTAAEFAKAIPLQQEMFARCDGILTVSEWARRSIVEDYGQPAAKVHTIGLGASIDPIEPAIDKYESQNILFVGRDWTRKGGPLLVEAFRKVRKVLPQATLTIIGVTPDVYGSGINVVGPLRRGVPSEFQRLREAYQRAQVFAMLSVFEPFGIVFLEAQLTRTPVVALAGQSRNEALCDGETGLIVQERNPNAVAEALISILRAPARSQRMGERGREFVQSRYTWQLVAQRALTYITTLS